MENPSHPSLLLQQSWIDIIRKYTEAAEKAGSLHQQQLELIWQQKWFKLLVPKNYGGLETSLPEAVRLEEALSWADGSFGWTVTLCCGAGWFGGFLDPSFADQIFANDEVCLGGSGADSGTAEITTDGYLLNGRWKYATGAIHTTNFTANCKITKNGQPVLTEDGDPLILPFVIDKNSVKLIPEWKCIGLIATGSHSFEIKQLEVPKQNCFKIDEKATVINVPVYRYPFLQLAETTLAANISGMAIHFLDLCQDAFADRIQNNKRLSDLQKNMLGDMLDSANRELNLVREKFYQALDNSWTFSVKNEHIPGDVLEEVSIYSRKLARYARQAVDDLYPFCGLIAANPETEINRVWRDLHTASQHSLLVFPHPES